MTSQAEDSAARNFFYSAIFWFTLAIIIGVVVAAKMVAPNLLGGIPWLQLGRLRPVHVTLAFFGWLSMANVGSMFYIIPRLCRVPLYNERLGNLTMWLWNALVAVGAGTLVLGQTQGKEYEELIWPLDIWFIILVVMVGYNLVMTLARRHEPQLYVSIWYFMGALFWVALVYIIGNIPIYSGINDAIVNWFYGHNLVGMWFTSAMIGIVYYLLPLTTGNPLYSHRLSLIGFWSFAFIYVWNGTHHIIYSAAPVWLQTVAIIFSVIMIIPVWTVVANFWMTMKGKWTSFEDTAVKFLVTGGFFAYLSACFQGPFQSLRTINAYTHFTNWVIGHAHIALLGSMTSVAFAVIYYVLPRVTGKELYSQTLGGLHFWLFLLGGTMYEVSMWVAGLIQGAMWTTGGIPFIRVVQAMHPYYLTRVLAGGLIVVAHGIFLYNITLTLRGKGTPREARLT